MHAWAAGRRTIAQECMTCTVGHQYSERTIGIMLTPKQYRVSHPGFEALVDDSSASGSHQGAHPEDPVLIESAAHYSRPKGPCRIHAAESAHSQQPNRPK